MNEDTSDIKTLYKMKVILSAIDRGFSVKRVSDKNNAYEFTISLNRNISRSKKFSRSVSAPITKKEFNLNVLEILY